MAAADASSSGFADHALLVEAIRALTVAQAKTLIKDVNNEPEATCGRLALSGNKPELINRLITSLTERKNQGDIRGYSKFRTLIQRYKGPPVTTSPYRNGSTSSAGTYGGLPAAGVYAAHPQPLGGAPANKASSIASSSCSPLGSAAPTASRPICIAGAARINFRSSPFYEIKQFVSPIVQCQEAPTQADRKNATLFVNLTPEQSEQLKNPAAYQLRLFCTTVEAHAASLSGRNPATIEFPLTCEARVNNHPLSTNLRGSKKNIGRVPPPNLNKDNNLVLLAGRPNRIDLTYTNAPKRHVLVAAICQVTSVDTLVERVRTKQFRSKEDLLSRMRREAADDDIEEGAATMSLKCPFSYMRIKTPSRSQHCSHVQCFGAESFFSVNEQTPSWECPICHRTIKAEDLIMDGFVADILKRVPQDQESVIVEPDGSWRTSDGKFSSTGIGQATPAAEGTPLGDRLKGHSPEEAKPSMGDSGKANETKRWPLPEIVLLDSPSPPPQRASAATSTSVLSAAAPSPTSAGAAAHQIRNGISSAPSAATNALRHERIELLSSSTNTSACASPAAGAADVIDLTLDSDDEIEPSMPARAAAPSNGSHSHASYSVSSSSRPLLQLPHNTNTNTKTNTNNSSSNGSANHSSTGNRVGFSSFAGNSTATPTHTGPFAAAAAAAAARVEATPEDEQIRRPGKRPRTEAIPTPTDPRRVQMRRPERNGEEQARRTSATLPASYLDVGGSNSGANGSSANGTSANGTATAVGATAGSGVVSGRAAAAVGRENGAYRETTEAEGEGGDDSWMDRTNTSDQEQYLDEDEWWP
ncbi:hypothetical protein NDA13_004958 [Ustilago tritici]|nr:hypothetical protein NDA13_004958 [Ustilago tritici]